MRVGARVVSRSLSEEEEAAEKEEMVPHLHVHFLVVEWEVVLGWEWAEEDEDEDESDVLPDCVGFRCIVAFLVVVLLETGMEIGMRTGWGDARL